MDKDKKQLEDNDKEQMNKIRRKNNRETLGILILYFTILIAPFVVGFLLLKNNVSRQQEVKEVIYEDDYASIYQEDIKIVFGPDCKVGAKEDKIVYGESCSCGYHQDTLIYDEWKITYKDQYGQTYVQTMNNMDSFEEQQLKWLTSQMEEHYMANQLKDYFDPKTYEGYQPVDAFGRNYVYVWFGNPIGSYSTDEEKKEMDQALEKEKEYHKELMKKLSSSENMIHLYELDYSKVYSSYPLRVIVHLGEQKEDVTSEQAWDYREIHEKKLDKVVESIVDEAGGVCNLEFRISVLYGDQAENDNSDTYEFTYYKSIIGGAEVDFGEYEKSYEQLLYYWYNENIW